MDGSLSLVDGRVKTGPLCVDLAGDGIRYTRHDVDPTPWDPSRRPWQDMGRPHEGFEYGAEFPSTHWDGGYHEWAHLVLEGEVIPPVLFKTAFPSFRRRRKADRRDLNVAKGGWTNSYKQERCLDHKARARIELTETAKAQEAGGSEMARKIVNCKACGKSRENHGRGLCTACYPKEAAKPGFDEKYPGRSYTKKADKKKVPKKKQITPTKSHYNDPATIKGEAIKRLEATGMNLVECVDVVNTAIRDGWDTEDDILRAVAKRKPSLNLLVRLGLEEEAAPVEQTTGALVSELPNTFPRLEADHTITLTFTGDVQKAIYDDLCRAAYEDFRSPAMEVLAILKARMDAGGAQ